MVKTIGVIKVIDRIAVSIVKHNKSNLKIVLTQKMAKKCNEKLKQFPCGTHEKQTKCNCICA